jgi:hypothetical protein
MMSAFSTIHSWIFPWLKELSLWQDVRNNEDIFAVHLHHIPFRQNLIVPDTSSISKLLFKLQLPLQLLLAQLCLFQFYTMNETTSTSSNLSIQTPAAPASHSSHMKTTSV